MQRNNKTLARTTAAVERSLRNGNNNPNRRGGDGRGGPLRRYAACRANPFLSTPSYGIPDSNNVKRLVVDHREYVDLTIGDADTFQVRLQPCLPYPLIGRTISGNTTGTWRANGQPIRFTNDFNAYDWAPLVTIKEYQDWQGRVSSTVLVDPAYSATKLRIVSLGMRWRYMGTAGGASGIVTINKAKLDVIPPDQTLVTMNYHNSVTAVALPFTAPAAVLMSPPANIYYNQDTISLRPEVTTMVRATRSNNLNPWLDVTSEPYALTPAVAVAQGYSYMGSPVTSASLQPVIQTYDDNWDVVMASFIGLPIGSVVRLEVAVCVEYQPKASSTVAPFAKHLPAITTDQHVSDVNSKLTEAPYVSTGAAASSDQPPTSMVNSLVKAISQPASTQLLTTANLNKIVSAVQQSNAPKHAPPVHYTRNMPPPQPPIYKVPTPMGAKPPRRR